MSVARYRMFAAYNAWANRRLYDAVAALPEAEYRADRGAFFKSLEGTLNHIVIADQLWLARFLDAPPPYTELTGIVRDDFASLRALREAEDARIIAYADSLTPADLNRRFSYRTITNPATVEQDLAPALDHFFNHQTHHRGQAHGILTNLGHDAPSLDLVYFQRESGFGGIKRLD
ncbi:MAG: damage-inducible protein DinB [Hyphomicrobiaceae bacterium]|nr:damage-inducible protein DinB [Hyphomicrobiaceae bacterium]